VAKRPKVKVIVPEARRMKPIDDENELVPYPSDDDVRRFLGVEPTKCRHGYSHSRHCSYCMELLFSHAMLELADACQRGWE
jgi:hypothetical protein